MTLLGVKPFLPSGVARLTMLVMNLSCSRGKESERLESISVRSARHARLGAHLLASIPLLLEDADHVSLHDERPARTHQQAWCVPKSAKSAKSSHVVLVADRELGVLGPLRL